MHFIRDKGKLLLLLFAALLVLAVIVSISAPAAVAGPDTADAYNVPWDVVASGGAVMSSASYTVMGTTGQPVAGPSDSSSYTLFAGYWQTLEDAVRELFLPAVVSP
ncbi:MAG: hypothetical protein ACK2UK_17950 [Candidatus Promineifilaceae bacterium]